MDESLLVLFSTVFTNSSLGNSNINDVELNIKSQKPIKNELDYVGNLTTAIPEFDLEPQLATEYYLKKAKQLFNKQFQEIARSNTPELSLKQVLLDQYSIADQVFNYYFETNQDADVFTQLINFKDPVRRYKEANDKYLVTKAARQVKEQIYNESLSLERKWADELVTLHQEALDSLIEKGIKDTDQELSYLSNALDKELIKYEKELNNKNKIISTNRRIANNKAITSINNKYKNDLKTFREKEKLRLESEKEKLKQKKIKEKERLKEKYKKQKNDEIIKNKNKELAARKNKMNKLNEEKKKIKNKNDEILSSLKNK